MNQKRTGILLSYCNLVVSMLVNIFLTPYLIYVLGDMEYSMYKVMQSFAGPLSMFHFGISTIVTRSIIRFQNAKNYSREDKENTIALSILSSIILSTLLIIIGIIMYRAIPMIYGETYSEIYIVQGQSTFLCFLCSTVFHVLTDVSSGCLIGHEKYIISSGIQFLKTVSKPFIIVLFLKLGFGIVAVAVVDMIISLLVFGILNMYTIGVLKEIPRLHYFDKKQLIEIFSFGMAILLQAFVNQINNSVDTMILGAYIEDKAIITMYSSALAIYAIYNSLISVITNYFLPNATKLVTKNASGKELTDFVIRPGRFQAIAAVACICGFILCGKDFIVLWIGEKYINAYWIILILMIPVTIPLVENAAISILDASLKRMYRSTVLAVMAVINIGVSILLIQKLSFWGAAIGTALSLIIGHGILMNVYYARTFKMQIIRMFYSIFKGILPCGIIAMIVCFTITSWSYIPWVSFGIKGVSFVVIYSLLLWLIGLNKNEKSIIVEMLHKK